MHDRPGELLDRRQGLTAGPDQQPEIPALDRDLDLVVVHRGRDLAIETEGRRRARRRTPSRSHAHARAGRDQTRGSPLGMGRFAGGCWRGASAVARGVFVALLPDAVVAEPLPLVEAARARRRAPNAACDRGGRPWVEAWSGAPEPSTWPRPGADRTGRAAALRARATRRRLHRHRDDRAPRPMPPPPSCRWSRPTARLSASSCSCSAACVLEPLELPPTRSARASRHRPGRWSSGRSRRLRLGPRRLARPVSARLRGRLLPLRQRAGGRLLRRAGQPWRAPPLGSGFGFAAAPVAGAAFSSASCLWSSL